MIKKILKKTFNFFGYSLHKKKKHVKQSKPILDNVFSMESALVRCVKRGLEINTVIDVGASDGRWSNMCMNIFPKASYILVEAQPEHEEGLLEFKNENPNIDYILAAAGKKNGTIYFDNTELFSGLATEKKLDENCIEVPMISLDSEIKKRNLDGPYLLKLDTHGFEIPILEGAKELIKKAELIIIETYNYKLTDDSLKYYEMCSYMEGLGFSSIEMVDFMRRKYDDSFWQMDTFFIPSSSKEFTYNSYS
ncbi:FkbM family methyltransferase [Urechidicola croceus]|uniref:Methyltransferase FkbM domain-containing protein n=1 Tax=Urechidicola croceus TaxID=1850246 RepID=A0A1D8P4J0_9FLAO|nr:FkbM family methyltransferase [Urechidicola croceus]AOW19502.1 hypothetical protein LPB138_01870 [Urechidicola croceus]